MSDAAWTPRAAPRALFLHGAGAWGGQWAIWRRVFEAEGWRVDAPDLQPAAAGLAATRLDDYVAQAADAIRPAPPTLLVGASLGGLVALAAARLVDRNAAASALQGLVLVNPLPPAPWSARLPPFVARFDAESRDVVPWRTQGRFDSTRRALRGASFADRQLAFRHWRDESAAVLREAHAGIVLPSPAVPVLVIASEADRDVPPEASAAFAHGIGADIARVPGGHVDPVMGATAAHAARIALAWSAASGRRTTP